MLHALSSGNRVTLLEAGAAYFPTLVAAIDAAKADVGLETYIFEGDETGSQVVQALARAAKRGVAVRVLVDGFGSPQFEKRLMPMLKAAGAQAMVYHRFRIFPAFSRLHRKVAVVDGRTALVGGINVMEDDPRRPGCDPLRLDYAVRIEGPLAFTIYEDHRKLWNRAAWRQFRLRNHAPRNRLVPGPQEGAPPSAGADLPSHQLADGRARWVVRNTLRHRRDIEKEYLKAIHGAHREIILANAYFLPGRRFRRALREAVRRGVEVKLLLQGVMDHPLAHYAGQELYAALLGSGVRLFIYRRSLLHAKVAVVDGAWATVGSSNIDPLSMLLAQEGNVVVQDAGFAAQLRTSLEAAMHDDAMEIRLEDLRKRPWPLRLRCVLAYGVLRVLAGLVGWH